MKITPYQRTQELIKEYQKVIQQKNVQEFARLNHQEHIKIQRQVWARPNGVDVLV